MSQTHAEPRLRPRQEAFCEYFVATGNAAEAARLMASVWIRLAWIRSEKTEMPTFAYVPQPVFRPIKHLVRFCPVQSDV